MKLYFVMDSINDVRGIFVSPIRAEEYAVIMKQSIDMDYMIMASDVMTDIRGENSG